MRKLSLLLLLLLLQLAMYGRGNTAPSLSQRTLSFIENKGQLRDQNGQPRTDIDFILQTKGMVLYIGKGQLHYQFIKENAKDTTHYTRENPPKHYQVSPGYTTYRLDVSLEGANASAAALKEGLQTAKYHYYNTAAPEGVTGVASYSRITYKDIYPGIDWVLYTRDGKLKYDFVVHPGAKPGDIKLNYAGASAMSLAKDGSLQITTPLGNLQEEAPYSYEQGTKKAVSSHYLLNGNTVSIAAGAYKGALVIDPGVEWATYFKGSTTLLGMTTDALGNVYLAGVTTNQPGLATDGAFQETFGGGNTDHFLAKFDSTGMLLWSTYYGGGGTTSPPFSGLENRVNVACDRFGHVYLAGSTLSENNIATPGSFQPAIDPLPNGFNNINGYLVQFNADGMRQWGTYYGASAHLMHFYTVACDRDGNVYAGGQADSSSSTTQQLVTDGAHQTQYGGALCDGLLVKFDSSGNRLWATYYGGEGQDRIYSVKFDDSNNVYIGGTSSSAAGIATPNGYQQSAGGGFAAKFTAAGSRIWGTSINAAINDIFLDHFNHLYLAGTVGVSATDTTLVTPGCWQYLLTASPGTPYNGLLMSFNPQNCTRNWGTYYGGERHTYGLSVTADSSGNIYFSGNTDCYDPAGTQAIASTGSHQDTLGSPSGLAAPPNDAFMAQFDTTGMRKWASYYGGAGNDGGLVVACAPSGAIYLAGSTSSTSGIATPGAYQDTSGSTYLVRWLPVDISIKRESPVQDTVCTGDVPLIVSVSNLGSMDDTGDVVITYIYTGPAEGGDTFTFTGGLPVGAVESYSLGTVPLDYEGTYDFTVYLHYTQDDNERNNDTLHFSLTTTTAEPVANIEYSQIGTNYQFSDPDGLSSYTYHWDFGDGDTSSEITPTHSYVTDGTYDVTLIVTGWCGSDTAHLSLDAVGTGTGVSGISNDNLLSVYPNPAKGDLYIKAAGLSMKRYEVVNALGQTVLNGSLDSQQDKINVSGLSAGSYYIRIDTNKGMAEKPFQVLR